MAKYQDIKGMGPSAVIPRKVRTDELPIERHNRRLLANAQHEADVRAWCEPYSIVLTVTNGRHHWKFTYRDRIAEWWPSSAKLVFQKQYQQGIHCHDYQQVMVALTKRWKLVAIEAKGK